MRTCSSQLFDGSLQRQQRYRLDPEKKEEEKKEICQKGAKKNKKKDFTNIKANKVEKFLLPNQLLQRAHYHSCYSKSSK